MQTTGYRNINEIQSVTMAISSLFASSFNRIRLSFYTRLSKIAMPVYVNAKLQQTFWQVKKVSCNVDLKPRLKQFVV